MKSDLLAGDMLLASLLKKCKEAGYVRVGVSYGSITVEPGKKEGDGKRDGWPAIWRIVEDDLKLPNGAGNSHQMQIHWGEVKEISYGYIMGIYKLSRGSWKKEEGNAGMFSVDWSEYDERNRGHYGMG